MKESFKVKADYLIAIKYNTMIIGTNHADGSFGDTGISIPIAYCIDKDGSVVFISDNDVRTRLLNFETKQVSVLSDSLILQD